MSDGKIRVRQIASRTTFDVYVVHNLILDADVTTLRTYLTTNQDSDEIDVTTADGAVYRCAFRDDDYTIVDVTGLRRRATITLAGYRM